jgi:hypothetical protein
MIVAPPPVTAKSLAARIDREDRAKGAPGSHTVCKPWPGLPGRFDCFVDLGKPNIHGVQCVRAMFFVAGGFVRVDLRTMVYPPCPAKASGPPA